MNTIYAKTDAGDIDMSVIEQAGRIVREGGLVAFPTETVYGLGADALCGASSKKIYEAKGRPSDNPLIIHIAELDDIYKIVKSVPPEALALAQKYWPGPLTMIFQKFRKTLTHNGKACHGGHERKDRYDNRFGTV